MKTLSVKNLDKCVTCVIFVERCKVIQLLYSYNVNCIIRKGLCIINIRAKVVIEMFTSCSSCADKVTDTCNNCSNFVSGCRQ